MLKQTPNRYRALWGAARAAAAMGTERKPLRFRQARKPRQERRCRAAGSAGGQGVPDAARKMVPKEIACEGGAAGHGRSSPRIGR